MAAAHTRQQRRPSHTADPSGGRARRTRAHRGRGRRPQPGPCRPQRARPPSKHRWKREKACAPGVPGLPWQDDRGGCGQLRGGSRSEDGPLGLPTGRDRKEARARGGPGQPEGRAEYEARTQEGGRIPARHTRPARGTDLPKGQTPGCANHSRYRPHFLGPDPQASELRAHGPAPSRPDRNRGPRGRWEGRSDLSWRALRACRPWTDARPRRQPDSAAISAQVE